MLVSASKRACPAAATGQERSMSLSHRQHEQLRRIDASLRRSDPELRAKFDMFGRLGHLGWEAGVDQTDGW
jgi:hypothetical protein